MKLFFVTSYHYPSHPAQFRHGLIMAREYRKVLGDDFLYAVYKINDRSLVSGISYVESNPRRFPLRKYRLISIYYFVWLGLFFLRRPRQLNRETVVITQESKIGISLLFWRRFFGYAYIFECHGLHSRLTDSAVCRGANGLIFVNRHLHDEAKKRFEFSCTAEVLPNAVDLDLFDRARGQSVGELRKELGLPSGTLIGYAGRFTAMGQSKGIETIFKAVLEANRKGVDVSVCCVGGKPEEIRRFEREAEEIGLGSKRVILRPFVTDEDGVPKYLAACDMLAYFPPPTPFFLSETSPMKLYEYMAARKPILVSDFPSVREILDDTSAILCDPADIQKIAERIAACARGTESNEQLAEAAYNRVVANTWNRRANSIIALARAIERQ